jgi:hypothetical protein
MGDDGNTLMTTPANRGRNRFNPKRSLREECDPGELNDLATRVRYSGNPVHKSDPGDFNLTPPAEPRPDKTLCDGVGIHSTLEATRLLRKGVKRGMISEQTRGGFPQNIWAVTEQGCPLEAQLENQTQGTYHGYPVPQSDPIRNQILERWSQQ